MKSPAEMAEAVRGALRDAVCYAESAAQSGGHARNEAEEAYSDALAAIDQMAARLEAAEQDAKRYRWLRATDERAGVYIGGWQLGSSLDAAIDDAMKDHQ